MKNPLDPRHQRREHLITDLFKKDFHKQRVSVEAEKIFSLRAELDAQIEKAAPEFPIGKINKVDLAILRLAVYELSVSKDAPEKVIVDEAIELAKEFGGQ